MSLANVNLEYMLWCWSIWVEEWTHTFFCKTFFFYKTCALDLKPAEQRASGRGVKKKTLFKSLKVLNNGYSFSAYANSVFNAFWVSIKGIQIYPAWLSQSLNNIWYTSLHPFGYTLFEGGTESLFHTDVFISKSKSLNSSRVINESGAVCCVLN